MGIQWDGAGAGLPVGVTSFNARTGVVTLLSADVVTALGYTPADAANVVVSFNTRTGAITLLDSDIIAALGYTPANDANVLHTTGDETKTGKLILTDNFDTNPTLDVDNQQPNGLAARFRNNVLFDQQATFSGFVGILGLLDFGTQEPQFTITGNTGTPIGFLWYNAPLDQTTFLYDYTADRFVTASRNGNQTIAYLSDVTGGGVASFNTRTGAVTLTDTDVIGALGYTPANAGVNVAQVVGFGHVEGVTVTSDLCFFGVGVTGGFRINSFAYVNSGTGSIELNVEFHNFAGVLVDISLGTISAGTSEFPSINILAQLGNDINVTVQVTGVIDFNAGASIELLPY